MTNVVLAREVGVWGRNNSFFRSFFLDDPDSVVSWFLFNDGAGVLPTESINDITAVSNTGTYTTRANQKFQGVEYIKANSELTNFGTSLSFLPDPSIDNELTLEIMFIPNRVGFSETHSVWCKGTGATNNTSFCFGWQTDDHPVIIIRFDSGGGDEGTAVLTATNVTLETGRLYHGRVVYDGDKPAGVLAALYIDDMTAVLPKVAFVGPAAPLNGIENTTSVNMNFGVDSTEFSTVTVIEAMVRTGSHFEQVLDL